MEKQKLKRYVDRDWRDLPLDMLGLIASKLVSFFDIVRFKGVCSSWRIAAPRRRKKPLSMLLCFAQKPHENSSKDIVQPNPYEYDDVLFVSINGNNPYQRKKSTCSVLRDIRNHKLIGSHPEGWLIMLDQLRHCYLFQLFSMIRIKLPIVMSCFGVLIYFEDQVVTKAVFSGEYNANQTVMIMMHDASCNKKLGIWSSGDKQWTCIESDNYVQIAFCHNEPYALRLDNYGYLYLEALDFGISYGLPEKKLSIKLPIRDGSSLKGLDYSKMHKLVSSSAAGEILVVSCLSDEHYLVWKVDLREKRCVYARSLNGNSLIFGNVTSALVLADDVEDHGYKRNAVYMVNNDYGLSILNLEDGGFEYPWTSEIHKHWKSFSEHSNFGLIHLIC